MSCPRTQPPPFREWCQREAEREAYLERAAAARRTPFFPDVLVVLGTWSVVAFLVAGALRACL